LGLPVERDEFGTGAIEGDGLNMRALLRVLLRYKWMLLALTLAGGLLATVQSLRSTAMYRTATLVQIDRTAQRVVAFGQDVDSERDVWDDGSHLTTQIELLKSRAMAERVIDELGLNRRKAADEALPEVVDEARSPDSQDGAGTKQKPGFLDRILSNYRKLNTPAITDSQFLDRNSVVGAFRGSVSIEPVRDSRLVNIAVTNSNPELAARIANTLAKTFMAVNLERRLESSTYARRFLEDQIKVTKTKLEESERLINDYSKRNQILAFGDRSDVASQNFSSLSASLARVEDERIKIESFYNEVMRNPESAPQVLDSKAVQALKEQRAKLETEYTQNLSLYKPEFPKMVLLRTQIDDLNARIKAEVNVVVVSIKAQYEAARQQEAQLRERVGQSRAAVETVQDRSVDLNLLKRELETNRLVYDSLLQRLKEVAVTGGLTTNNISIVDEAKPPLFPFSPDPGRYALIGMGLGLLLGLGLAFLRENLDDSVKHPDEIEPSYGLPVLGLIPLVKKSGRAGQVASLVHDDPRSAFSEAYRSMRTALQFSTNDGAPKLMMVTSCGKAEGKTTTAIALAINFAQMGKQVLLVDADMRNPSVHKTMMLHNESGLSNFLAGEPGAGTLIQKANINNLSVLTAGPMPPDPVELLMGSKFQLLLEKAQELGYSQVIIDSPPLLGIADAVVLGNQIPHVIFTIKSGSTRKSAIRDALRRLRHGGISPMGVVLTHVNDKHGTEYGYGSYYGYEAESQAPRAGFASLQGGESGPGGQQPITTGATAANGVAFGAGKRARRWLVPGLAAGTVAAAALAAGVWWMVSGDQEPVDMPMVRAVNPSVSEVAKGGETNPATPAVAAAASVAPADPALGPVDADAVSASVVATVPPPDLKTIQDKPEIIWPPLGQLWGARLNPASSCESALSLGVQCFRQVGIGMPELQALDRPGLVQLAQGVTKRWVLLRGMDAGSVTLSSGDKTWQLPLADFQKSWSGAFTTLWRLPPGHRTRVFAAEESDPAGQWLNEQLKHLQTQQKLAATDDSLRARVSQFQQQHNMPRDGKAMPPVFVLVNRLAGVDEPRL
jgi:capsular exopolysaccharide synthesis family protein